MFIPFSSTITHEDRIGRTIIMSQNKTIDRHSSVLTVVEFGSQIIARSALLKVKRAIIAGY